MMMAKKPSGGIYDDFFGEIPNENKEFSFPLYITVPFSDASESFRIYYKTSSEIVESLWNWFFENAVVEEDDVTAELIYSITDPNLFINGVKISEMYTYGDFEIYLVAESLDADITVGDDYSLFIILYGEIH